MNKPLQLDLVAEAITAAPADIKPAVSNLIADLARAGADPDLVGRVANAITDHPCATSGDPEACDWSPESPDLLVPCQPATQAYWNGYGQAVIRQRAEEYGEDDPYLVFNRESLAALIRRLQDMQKAGPQ